MRSPLVASVVVWIGAAAALFGAAGRFDIPAFWIYLTIFAALSIVGRFIIDPDLANERLRPGGRPMHWRYQLLALLMLVHLIVAGLDHGRFHWSFVSPLWQGIGLALYALSAAGFMWAMYVNRFFSSVPRIQSERGHHVITSGPYQWVRHPGYTAALVLTLVNGIALGSWAAAAIGLIGVPLLYWRITFEDRMLHEQLPGYRDYAARVPYRLIPYVW